MGCTGSKANKASAAQATGPVVAQAGTTGQIPEGDFKIILESPTGSADLGVKSNFPEKKYIVVECINEKGLIPSWNEIKQNTPELQVKAGDTIVAINGVFGDSDLMLAELQSKSLTLTIKSGPASPSTTQEATAGSTDNPVAEAIINPVEASTAETAATDAAVTDTAVPAEAIPDAMETNRKLMAEVAVLDALEVVVCEPDASEVPNEERNCGCAACETMVYCL